MTRRATVPAMALLAVSAAAGRGDDSALIAAGGDLKPMRGHPTVRMVEEQVHVVLPAGSVDARFVFHNDGPATTVTVGFPEEGKNANGGRHTDFGRFASWVDGRPAAVRRIVTQGPTTDNDDQYEAWWVKTLRFAAGQTCIVTDRYQSDGWITSYGCRGFEYILKSGASWNGTIGRARIVCDLAAVASCAPLRASPAGYRRTGNRLTWDLRDFKPRDNVLLWWFDGFADVTVDGRRAEPLINGMPSWNGNEGPAPRRDAREVWLSAETAARWLGAKLTTPAVGRIVRLSRDSRWAEAVVAKSVLRSSAGGIKMPDSVHVKDGHVRVALTAVARALGGRSTWLADGRLAIQFAGGGK